MKVTLYGTLIVAIFIVTPVLIVRKQLSDEPTNYTTGVNGIVENRCINGYLFVVGKHGHVRQMINADGKGIKCN